MMPERVTGYENGKRKYPVLYLLHGNACDENSWLDLGRAAQILDNLIAAGKAEPMIVVMTNGNPAQQAAPAYFGDTYTNANTRPGIASFTDSFKEVISFIDGISIHGTRLEMDTRFLNDMIYL